MYKTTTFGKNEILTFFPHGQNGQFGFGPEKKIAHRKQPGNNSLKS